MDGQCCCSYGAAVKGEWPEFECYRCLVHGGELAEPTEMCKRHKREAARTARDVNWGLIMAEQRASDDRVHQHQAEADSGDSVDW